MNIMESIRLACAGLRSNKMRTVLTMLGIIIGIASVIAILTVGDGLSSSVTSSMSSLGATNITIAIQNRESEYTTGRSFFTGSGGIDDEDLISSDMIDALISRYPDAVADVSLSESVGSGKAKLGRDYANVSVTGINEDYLSVNSVDVIKGRSLIARDVDGVRNAAIVSDRLVDNLYNGDAEAALGEELVVDVNGEYLAFTIVGVYEYEATSFSFSMSSDRDITTSLYIPVTTAKKLADAPDGYSSFTLTSSESVDSAAFASQASDFLNLYYENNEDYRVMAISMETMLNSLNTMMDTISIALSVIAGISLLVGGIGVMNIMLVSVTERTREIGTRKALGATNGNIRVQFVVESMIVCLIGGVIGIILGGVLGYIGSSLINAVALPSFSSILISVGFSLAIGVFFGYYPANKAARLDPIEALRYE